MSIQDNPTTPDDLPEIISIPLPPRLLIPLGSRGGNAKPKPPGTVVTRGQPVAEKAAESSHIPLAPAPGTPGEGRGGGRTPETSASDEPSLLHGLERIRAAGVWADRQISPDLI